MRRSARLMFSRDMLRERAAAAAACCAAPPICGTRDCRATTRAACCRQRALYARAIHVLPRGAPCQPAMFYVVYATAIIFLFSFIDEFRLPAPLIISLSIFRFHY
jgi:hypothetical protein